MRSIRRSTARAPAIALYVIALLLPLSAPAADGDADNGTGALARLQAFSTELTTFTADFEQSLYDEDSTLLQRSEGTIALKRPSRFIWDYAEPASQTIVADGERVWFHDRDLAQVTVNDLDERVDGTPFVLLMGTAQLDEAYEITALGASDGVDWLELVPKADGGDFEALFVGLAGDELAALELRDAFGQATQITFSNVESGVSLDDEQFEFVVPDGVDVIGLEQ